LPDFAQASPWEKLGRNARYEVALDMASVRLTTSGRLGVWLRFTPLGESQRRQAVTEFKKKAYRLHMEYYEINCDEDRAVLGLRDIIGTKGKRLLRFMGEGDPEAVEPGSILELAVQRICPVVEENSAQDMQGAEGTDIATVGKDTPEIGIPPEARQHITDLLKRTGADPADPAAWAELGNAYFDSDMPREAIEAYSRSLALKPDNTDVLNDQGAMYRQAGDITQALKNFEKALGIDQHNLESLYNIGYIYAFDLNRIGRALETWRRYLELDRSSETARQVQSFIELYDH
jgi:tetratricopeptide (TPR) repeat protein